MSKLIDHITTQVQNASNRDQVLTVLCGSIADQITQSSDDPTTLANFARELRAVPGELQQAFYGQFKGKTDGVGQSVRM